MDIVYQTLWDADQRGNGVPALRPEEEGDAARGYVIVDEPTGPVAADWAVLREVVIPDNKRQTYDLCLDLMNNYALERRAREVQRPQELAEEGRFIEVILETEVIQTARRIMEEKNDIPVPDPLLAAKIRECWFELGQAGGQTQASGFEHVFVGEQASKPSKIGGYHYWHKFWVDDGGSVEQGVPGIDRIVYRGPKYGGAARPEQGVLVPEVVTLQMEWDAPGGDGGTGRLLTKPIGGFFVGCSPEGLIALGLVRSLTESGKLATINGAEYQLDLHRLDNKRGIRTFFPRFLRANVTQIDPAPAPSDRPANGTVTGSTPPSQPEFSSRGAGVFRILAAMVNPRNPEGGREFLQIINASDQMANIRGWSVTAPNGSRFHLADRLMEPGEIFRFTLPGAHGVLRNKGGEIGFHDPAGSLVQLCSYSSEDAQTEGAVILF